MSFISSGANPGCTLYNSVASTCKCLWWIVTDLSMLSSSSNVDCLSYRQVLKLFHDVYLSCYCIFSYGSSIPENSN